MEGSEEVRVASRLQIQRKRNRLDDPLCTPSTEPGNPQDPLGVTKPFSADSKRKKIIFPSAPQLSILCLVVNGATHRSFWPLHEAVPSIPGRLHVGRSGPGQSGAEQLGRAHLHVWTSPAQRGQEGEEGCKK